METVASQDFPSAAATWRIYAARFCVLCHVSSAYADDQLMDAVVPYEQALHGNCATW
jgi:hypothetical protein